MWESYAPLLVGTGPTAYVVDRDLNPNDIIDWPLGGAVRVDFSFTGLFAWVLPLTTFDVAVYAESIGPGPEGLLGTATVVGFAGAMQATIPIPPSSTLLRPSDPNVPRSGVYRLTVAITNHVTSTGFKTQLAGFVDGPTIEVRSP